jgi:hypothetical protein
MWSGRFQSILSAPTYWDRKMDSVAQRAEFLLFNHRGKVLAKVKEHFEKDQQGSGNKKNN